MARSTVDLAVRAEHSNFRRVESAIPVFVEEPDAVDASIRLIEVGRCRQGAPHRMMLGAERHPGLVDNEGLI